MYICVYIYVYYGVYLSKSSFFTGVSPNEESLSVCGGMLEIELFGDMFIPENSSVVSAAFSAGAAAGAGAGGGAGPIAAGSLICRGIHSTVSVGVGFCK